MTRSVLFVCLGNICRSPSAEGVFRADLRKYPANGWSLLGVYQSLAAQDENEEAKGAKAEFEKAWQRADVKLKRPAY